MSAESGTTWESYRRVCDRGDVLSRWMLERSRALLLAAGERDLAERIADLLTTAPVAKPPGHRAGAATDFFVLDLDPAAGERILSVVTAAAAAGTRTAEGRSLAGFSEAWQEYVDWMSGTHPRSPHRAAQPPW